MAKKKDKKPEQDLDLSEVALRQVLEELEKDVEIGRFQLGIETAKNIVVVPSGLATLDIALGCGGIPRGRVMEIYGPESGGKTTLALKIISSFQRTTNVNGMPGRCLFIDAEHALDPEWASNIGVDIEEMIINQPSSGEAVFKIIERVTKSNAIDLVVVDSVAAMLSKAELEGDFGDNFVGAQARMLSQGLKKLVPIVSNSNTTVIFINQIREKVGVMFGNPETTPGGRALKFYASLRFEVRRTGIKKESEVPVGSEVKVKIVKNKVAPPFKEAEFIIHYGPDPVYGPWTAESMIRAGVDRKIITVKGNAHSLDGVFLGSGVKQAAFKIDSEIDLYEKLQTSLRARFKCQSENIEQEPDITKEPEDDENGDTSV